MSLGMTLTSLRQNRASSVCVLKYSIMLSKFVIFKLRSEANFLKSPPALILSIFVMSIVTMSVKFGSACNLVHYFKFVSIYKIGSIEKPTLV